MKKLSCQSNVSASHVGQAVDRACSIQTAIHAVIVTAPTTYVASRTALTWPFPRCTSSANTRRLRAGGVEPSTSRTKGRIGSPTGSIPKDARTRTRPSITRGMNTSFERHMAASTRLQGRLQALPYRGTRACADRACSNKFAPSSICTMGGAPAASVSIAPAGSGSLRTHLLPSFGEALAPWWCSRGAS